jgi:Fic family protein
MRAFDYSVYRERLWDTETVNYLSALHEARGRVSLLSRGQDAALKRLAVRAAAQSTEASCAIEGIRTGAGRLKQLAAGTVSPRNRNEEEILGYRDALEAVFAGSDNIPVTPDAILGLHRILFAHTGDAYGGQYKTKQNYIGGADALGNRFILFTPLPPQETPRALEELCVSFNVALGDGEVDPLLMIPIFILDFLAIHPFADGNGRMSRLLTDLLLYRCGWRAVRYVSLEAKTARHKDFYYEALRQSEAGWRAQTNDPVPFIKSVLGALIGVYRDLEERLELPEEKHPSLETVRSAVRRQIGKFKKADVLEMCPSVSAASVERGLNALCRSGEVSRHGKGRSTYYLRETV